MRSRLRQYCDGNFVISRGHRSLCAQLLSEKFIRHKGRKEITRDTKGFSSSFVFLCGFFVFFVFPCRAEWQLKTVSSLQKLTAIKPGVLENFKSEPASLHAVRGEWENFQIVVQAGDKRLETVEPILNDLTSQNKTFPSENIKVFWENYVYVPHPSGNRRLEKLWWPDALIPAEDQNDTSVEPNRARVLWVNVRVPENAALGFYEGQIQIRADGETKNVPFSIGIGRDRRTGLDALPAPTFRANVALYYDVLRDWYAKNARPLSDEEVAQLKKNYYDFLLDYRINAYDLPVDWKSDEAQQYLKDPRVLSVRTPPLDRADFNEALSAFNRANELKKAYYYWIDEPAPEQYAAVKNATKKLRALGIQHCVTAFPNESLKNDVDIWCPNIGDFFGLNHFDLWVLSHAKGQEKWIYTMAWPRYPYPTWLLDDDASAIRFYGSWMRREGIKGFVYSMAHGWGPKPLENLQSFGETNGDGTLLYPAAALDKNDLTPLPSIRLMLLRDAIEDYELQRNYEPDDLRYSVLNKWPGCVINLGGSPIRSGPTAKIDGVLNDATWNDKTLWNFPLRRLPEETAPVTTKVWLTHKNNNLLVAARCELMPHAVDFPLKGEWFAVDLASQLGVQFEAVRWRFIVTPSGKGIVEKHTREGHFRIEGINWKFAAKASRGFYNVEMQIPLKEIKLGHFVSWNVRRRLHDTKLDIHYLLHAYPDNEDITEMPGAELK